MEKDRRRKELEKNIRAELTLIKNQISQEEETNLVVWVIPGKLALAQRPLRYHPQFGGYDPLPIQARTLVVSWIERIRIIGFRSIICLLMNEQLDRYYVRGGINLHPHGLLGYYESQGFEVRHFPLTDYQRLQKDLMEKVFVAFNEPPRPVLLHCSAGIDRSTPVAAYITLNQKE